MSDTQENSSKTADEMSSVEIVVENSGVDSVETTLMNENNPFELLREESLSGTSGQAAAGTSQDLMDFGSFQSKDSQQLMDSDSGIYNVEMEDTDGNNRGSDDSVAKLCRQLLMRVLNITSASNSREQEHHMESVLKCISELDDDLIADRDKVANFVQEVLVDILQQIHGSSEKLFTSDSAQESLSCSPSKEYTMMANHFGMNASPGSSVAMSPVGAEIAVAQDTKELEIFTYLAAVYDRLKLENNPHEEQTPPPGLLELRGQLFCQVLRFATLLLQGYITRNTVYNRHPHTVLLLSAMVRSAIPSGYMEDLMQCVKDNREEFDQVFKPLLNSLTRVIRTSNMTSGTFRQPLLILAELCEIKFSDTNSRPFCEMLTRQPQWIPAAVSEAEGREINLLSVIGPFLSPSVFMEDCPAVASHYFFDGSDDSAARLQYPTIRGHLESLRSDMHRVFHSLFANSSTREQMLIFVQEVVQRNIHKAKMHSQPSMLASNGFLMNFVSVMYKMSEKVTLDKVNPLYPFHPSAKIDIKEVDRLKLRTTDLEQFEKSIDTSSFAIKFPMECFFLTLHAQHVSVVPIMREHGQLERQETDFRQAIQRLENSRSAWEGNSATAIRNRQIIENQKAAAAKYSKSHMCSESVVCDDLLLDRVFQFCERVMAFLVRQLCPEQTVLPLPEPISQLFGALPEFYLEDVLEILLFMLRHTPAVLDRHGSMDMAQALLVLTCSPHLFNNPSIPARLVEILFMTRQQAVMKFHSLMFTMPMAVENLFCSLIKFYSDCEHTGSDHAFHEKFSTRYHIQMIFKSMWLEPSHRMLMINQCNECGNEFIRFVNMLINDTTYLLDEALSTLPQIRETQDLMANPTEWNRLDATNQNERLQQEAQVRSLLQLTKETLDMFVYMTEQVKDPFLAPQLGDRLAAMLNYNLAMLCGPKCNNLRVKNPEKYFFEPKRLLNQLTDIYLNLASERFAECLANDERSFSEELLKDVINRLSRHHIKSIIQIERFSLIADQAIALWKAKATQEEDLGDIPDEFCDPIMGTLMTDPVRLPSGHVVDKGVIMRHLLSDILNPFNRQPLTAEMLEPEVELKQRVENWVKSRRTKM